MVYKIHVQSDGEHCCDEAELEFGEAFITSKGRWQGWQGGVVRMSLAEFYRRVVCTRSDLPIEAVSMPPFYYGMLEVYRLDHPAYVYHRMRHDWMQVIRMMNRVKFGIIWRLEQHGLATVPPGSRPQWSDIHFLFSRKNDKI